MSRRIEIINKLIDLNCEASEEISSLQRRKELIEFCLSVVGSESNIYPREPFPQIFLILEDCLSSIEKSLNVATFNAKRTRNFLDVFLAIELREKKK